MINNDNFDEYVKSLLQEFKNKISDQIAQVENNYSNKECQDILYARIRKTDTGHVCFKKIDDDLNKMIKNHKIIVLVLESPHKDEYKDKKPIAPARGGTGNSLDTYLSGLITPHLKDEITYEIVLMNSIQYQCSLGAMNTKVYRDRIWIYCWFKLNARKNFSRRLSDYKPDIILNLCTKGDHECDVLAPYKNGKMVKKIDKIYIETVLGKNCNYIELFTKNKYTLQQFVQCEIDKYKIKNNDLVCLVGCHPSSWSRDTRKRKIQIVSKN